MPETMLKFLIFSKVISVRLWPVPKIKVLCFAGSPPDFVRWLCALCQNP
jgi:hypothetical protein